MSLVERLEAKRRDIDQQARGAIRDSDYVWWCELRELFDELIAPPILIMPPGGIAHLFYDQSSGYIVARDD